MTLPAHRFRDREERKPSIARDGGFQGASDPGRPTHLMQEQTRPVEERKKNDDGSRVWCVDYDGTITGAPEQMSRIAQGLKALGDRIIVLTGNKSPRADLVKQLGAYGFPFDELIQYHDDGTNGLERAEYLKRLDAWGAFDNRIDRAIILAEVCPHLFLLAEPTDEEKQNAKDAGSKKNAKKAAENIGLRSDGRDAPHEIPPDFEHPAKGPHHCSECIYFDGSGVCTRYDDEVEPVDWCSSFKAKAVDE